MLSCRRKTARRSMSFVNLANLIVLPFSLIPIMREIVLSATSGTYQGCIHVYRQNFNMKHLGILTYWPFSGT